VQLFWRATGRLPVIREIKECQAPCWLERDELARAIGRGASHWRWDFAIDFAGIDGRVSSFQDTDVQIIRAPVDSVEPEPERSSRSEI
jgi:hypothetical protein